MLTIYWLTSKSPNNLPPTSSYPCCRKTYVQEMQANFNMDKVNEDHLLSPVISTVLNYLPFGLGESGADCISRALASYIREKLVGGYTSLGSTSKLFMCNMAETVPQGWDVAELRARGGCGERQLRV